MKRNICTMIRFIKNIFECLHKAPLMMMCLIGISECANAQWLPILPSKLCGADSSLYSVSFFDHDHAYAVGENGAAYRSSDGGATFSPMMIAENNTLYEVRFASAVNGFICGDRGLFAATTTGGMNWDTTHLQGFEQRALYAMEWLTPEIGFIAGGSSAVAHGQINLPDGFILRTTDAGKTWKTVLQDATNFFWSLAIQRRADGNTLPHVTSSGPLTGGRILYSTDQGVTWSVAATQLPFLPHDISFLPHMGVAVGGNPLDFNASAGIAYQNDLTHWSVVPDTISTKGFAWSVEAFVSDSTGIDVSASWTVLIGLQSGKSLRSDGLLGDRVTSINVGPEISRCAIYDFAVHREVTSNGLSWQTNELAAGSGRGLFRNTGSGNVTSVEDVQRSEKNFSIEYIFPNPPAGIVAVQFRIDTHSAFRISLIDHLGREVATTTDQHMDSGLHEIQFETANLSNGLYLISLKDGKDFITKKLVIMR